MRHQRLTLQFESVRFRAEVFLNDHLCGYDLVNSTPFEVDITPFINPSGPNRLAIRITDPNGNFNWKDSQVYNWGDYLTNPSHGFGGITGKITLTATDPCYIENVFIKNKPDVRTIDAVVTLQNQSDKTERGQLLFAISDPTDGKTLVSGTLPVEQLSKGQSTCQLTLRAPQAQLWSCENPHLYQLKVSWKGSSTEDEVINRFGFRWFEVRESTKDKQFFLNGKRIVLRTAISWGFWPFNGITPDSLLAYRQVKAAKSVGLNMLNFHRAIGQPLVMQAADELGLLIWEEPGGNQFPADYFQTSDPQRRKQADFYFAYRNEKLARMIQRDRNHPSLIIYTLHNERGAAPQAQDYQEMQLARQLDNTRILVYNSSNGDNPEYLPNPRFKTHYLPYDTTCYQVGWWDTHHAGGPGVYHDNLYESPDNYLRRSTNKAEIVYWGEEGAIGTPPRLQLIRDEILQKGQTNDWESDDYLKWYDAYDQFLKTYHFNRAFPSVDALTRSMGNVALYYQGRIIENIRINNIVDGYAVNGWESMKLENHSGIVDNFRHPKGDTTLM
jgi:beta-galactosidase/beta-glucuronidase